MSEISVVVEDIWSIVRSSQVAVNFIHVPRSANCVAHSLVKLSFAFDHSLIWMENYPSSISSLIAVDIGSVSFLVSFPSCFLVSVGFVLGQFLFDFSSCCFSFRSLLGMLLVCCFASLLGCCWFSLIYEIALTCSFKKKKSIMGPLIFSKLHEFSIKFTSNNLSYTYIFIKIFTRPNDFFVFVWQLLLIQC
ncbi:hypothetical protein ACOSQ3_016227 [Xanthoceras sorbifolium]